jgi:solute carrier family 35, member C2
MVKFSVAKATEFNLWGFILIMLAAVLSGFRWAMTQILLQVNIFLDVISFLFFGF